MSEHDEDPARGFLDQTLPGDDGWIDPCLPRRPEPVVVVAEPSRLQKALPVVSTALFAAFTVDVLSDS